MTLCFGVCTHTCVSISLACPLFLIDSRAAYIWSFFETYTSLPVCLVVTLQVVFVLHNLWHDFRLGNDL